MQQPVALKRLLEEDSQAFERETSIMRNLQHTNIVTYFGCCDITATTRRGYTWLPKAKYMVIEYVDIALYKLIKSTESFPYEKVITMFREMLSAVIHMHSRHVMHRDIKSDNVLVSKTG